MEGAEHRRDELTGGQRARLGFFVADRHLVKRGAAARLELGFEQPQAALDRPELRGQLTDDVGQGVGDRVAEVDRPGRNVTGHRYATQRPLYPSAVNSAREKLAASSAVKSEPRNSSSYGSALCSVSHQRS